MTNLRKVEEYSIGLDLGTNSVGWAVIDGNGDLCHFKGKPTWGSRLFSAAEQASAARSPRSLRRRYIRRRNRINLLQSFFVDEISKVDPDFFVRLNQSYLVPGDRTFGHPLFNGFDFEEADYYEKFPTIFHLRKWLMETEEKADIRLVYLAMHNIVKHRGNFLQQDNESLSSKTANPRESVMRFCDAFVDWCNEEGISSDPNADGIIALLTDKSLRRDDLKKSIPQMLAISATGDSEAIGFDRTAAKKMGEEIAKAFIGYKADFTKVYLGISEEGASFKLSDDEGPEQFASLCPDNGMALFESIQAVYSAYVLQGILSVPGSISENKVAAYDRYGADLKLSKELVRQCKPESYDEFFRGEHYADDGIHGKRNAYDASKAKGYTRYNMGPSKTGSGAKPYSYDDFRKDVAKLLGSTDASLDERYISMMNEFYEGRFLRRLRTSDNGQIPFQLNLEELEAIVDNQAKHYPFLAESKDKLVSIVRFRIPYYVGPLTRKNAAKDKKQELRFAWSERKPGMEDAKVYPWNWEDVIDRHASAEHFITRMTGTCTYVEGEPVLPRCSLLYEEFCVLNELNGAKFTQDGDDFRRFSFDDREEIFEDLFLRGRVTYKKVADWMRMNKGFSNVHVSGGQGETAFESKMGSYIFFCKDIFGVERLPRDYIPMVEEIILWNTLFEDRSILKEKIAMAYGEDAGQVRPCLSDDQIKKICKKRFTGWGRLSKKFLTGIKADTDNGPKSIMDILREGGQNNDRPGRAMVLMEILHDDRLGFESLVDEANKKARDERGGFEVNDLPGSPANRRTINQAVRIVEEIVGIAGKQPKNIFVEVTRDEDLRKKGVRTNSRFRSLEESLNKLGSDASQVLKELKGCDKSELAKEKLYLYFAQNGKSLYSGKPLRIEDLSEYQVDHIIPQSYLKDDSLENKALVLPSENQRKSDELLISGMIQRSMKHFWDDLHDAGLIGDKKYNNLTCRSVSDGRLKGFVARQLVETSQIVKFTQQILGEMYSETRVLPIKAAVSHDLREACDFPKIRELNNYHHAHDAYLACQVGRFVLLRHPAMYDNPIGMVAVVRKFIRAQAEEYHRTLRPPMNAGFIVSSFMKPGFDVETGEVIRDSWNPDDEVARMTRCLNYRDCFISRMPEEYSGAFWDSTIYSPRMNKPLPIKNDREASKYGSFSGEQFAYFMAYKAINPNKKGAVSIEFAPVPASWASKAASDPDAVVSFAVNHAAQSGLLFMEVVREKIYKYQLFEQGGGRFFVTGKEEARNGSELYFSLQEQRVINDVIHGAPVERNDVERVFKAFGVRLERFAPRTFKAIKWLELELRALAKCDSREMVDAIVAVAQLASASLNKVDLQMVGGSKFAGKMSQAYAKSMSNRDDAFVFVDQSVTGMYERRWIIGL